MSPASPRAPAEAPRAAAPFVFEEEGAELEPLGLVEPVVGAALPLAAREVEPPAGALVVVPAGLQQKL